MPKVCCRALFRKRTKARTHQRTECERSAFGGKADYICSQRELPLLTDTVEKVLVIFGEQ
jgi:hypothetical protein